MRFSDFIITYWYYSAAVVVTGILLLRNLFDLSSEGAISAFEATNLINRQHAVLVDVRTAEAFKSGHISQSINLGLDEIKPEAFKKYKTRPIIVVCETGAKAASARIKLMKALPENPVYNLKGGISQWKTDGLPLKQA